MGPFTAYQVYGYQVSRSSKEKACAVRAPGQRTNKSAINVNDFHCAAGHSHERLFLKIVEQQGIVVEGEPGECRGCSMVKDTCKGIEQSTHTSR